MDQAGPRRNPAMVSTTHSTSSSSSAAMASGAAAMATGVTGWVLGPGAALTAFPGSAARREAALAAAAGGE